jgi:hypothetical protein
MITLIDPCFFFFLVDVLGLLPLIQAVLSSQVYIFLKRMVGDVPEMTRYAAYKSGAGV